ncbi:hypothetical protein [Ruegeria sp. HKCCA4008]|uniref:hypothetical protein n=1 Tax=Ruegeria sp. HKCCA4008 TaxID=2682999 RepID=UPI0014896ACE|nr:hypothetical protein [Ruegeria sp. HKCCA4008]
MRGSVWIVLTVLATLTVSLLTFAVIGTPMGHSYGFNMSWAVAFADALNAGAIYPRFLPALWDGVGGLDFFFYAPLPFYVAAGPAQWVCPDCSPQVLLGLSGGFLCWLSGVTFWIFGRQFLPPKPALVAAFVWALAPYHVGIDWMVRQAAGEFAAYVFVPLAAHGVLVALRDRCPVWSLPVGLAGLGLSHLPTLLLVVHVMAVIVVAWILIHRTCFARSLVLLAGLGIVGVALSAFYWLPAIMLLGDVSPEGLYTKELIPESWYLIGADVLPDSMYKLALLICQLTAAAVAGLAVLMTQSGTRRNLIIWALGPAILVIVLNSSFSRVLWENWIIAKVQFPYRLTVVSDLALALSVGTLSTAFASDWRSRRIAWIGFGGLLISFFAVGMLVPDRVAKGIAARRQPVAMIGAPEYLPPAVFDPLAEEVKAESQPIWRLTQHMLELTAEIEAAGSGFSLPVQEAPRQWIVRVEASGQPEKPLRVALMYWSHMKAETTDGTPLALSWDPETGFVTFARVEADVRIILPRHWSEWIGVLLTGFGLIAAVFILFGARGAERDLTGSAAKI